MMKPEHRTAPARATPTLSPDGDRAFTPPMQRAPASAGVWLLIAVITVLFFLFTVAYRIRMSLNDWQPMSEPWQLGVSTVLLVLGCVALHLCCRKAALLPSLPACRPLLQLAVGLTLGFVLAQLWVWQQLLAMNIRVGHNPANSFFYLLTGLHGVHVLGGLVALGWVIYHARYRRSDALYSSLRLCARYWHFLLLIWLFLLGLFRFT